MDFVNIKHRRQNDKINTGNLVAGIYCEFEKEINSVKENFLNNITFINEQIGKPELAKNIIHWRILAAKPS